MAWGPGSARLGTSPQAWQRRHFVSVSDGGLAAGTIIEPELDVQPKPSGEAFFAFLMGGDFVENDEPVGNLVVPQMNECITQEVKSMCTGIREAGVANLVMVVLLMSGCITQVVESMHICVREAGVVKLFMVVRLMNGCITHVVKSMHTGIREEGYADLFMVVSLMNESITQVVKSMHTCIKEEGVAKLFMVVCRMKQVYPAV